MNRPRLPGRDYKRHAGKQGFTLTRWREFVIGLGVGIVIAVAVYVTDHRRPVDLVAADARPKPRTKAVAKDVNEPEESATRYDFYDMLPKFEVIVPEKERDVRRDLPAAQIERPGVYVLQAGSYRNQDDAERVRVQLDRLGIEAKLQRVAVDADVWHRVRIGPISDLNQLNQLRNQLRKADIDALVIRVGD